MGNLETTYAITFSFFNKLFLSENNFIATKSRNNYFEEQKMVCSQKELVKNKRLLHG